MRHDLLLRERITCGLLLQNHNGILRSNLEFTSEQTNLASWGIIEIYSLRTFCLYFESWECANCCNHVCVVEVPYLCWTAPNFVEQPALKGCHRATRLTLYQIGLRYDRICYVSFLTCGLTLLSRMLESSVTLANGEVKIKNAARELSQLSSDSISSPAISGSAASELDCEHRGNYAPVPPADNCK